MYTELSEQVAESIESKKDIDEFGGLDEYIALFIEELPDEYRDIVRESELQGIRQKDLAEKYGMPYISLRSRAQRGRERLKKMFMQCCSLELDANGNLQKIGRWNPCNSSSKSY